MNKITCFKSYDVRGELGPELDEEVAYRIGVAFSEYLKAKKIVLGGDIRLSTESLKAALADGITDTGADVIDVGMTGSEELYFASSYLDVDGGIEVTGSHNPKNYNGMKFVGRDALPIGQDSGLREIQALAENVKKFASINKGTISTASILEKYTDKLLTFFSHKKVNRLKIVCNPGNGAAGHVIDEIEKRFRGLSIPIEFVKINFQADGTFPNGVPNPLLPEYRKVTSDAVLRNEADIGIAWDGDFDRCFLFDEKGQFIEGYYIVGLLAAAFLSKMPGEKIVYDPRMIWNTIDIVTLAGGIPVQCKSGHTFMKERMRAEKAVYGGEMSAHHYFKDFSYCDSGMIPWLLAVELLSTSNMPLSKLVGERIAAYPCSGEINYKVADAATTIREIKSFFSKEKPNVDATDGLSMSFEKWRFNLRASNTEPLLRLNVESKGDEALMREKLQLVESRIKLTS